MRFFASPRASARNDRALLVNGVRRGLRPRLTPPQKIEGVIPNEAQRNEESPGGILGSLPPKIFH